MKNLHLCHLSDLHFGYVDLGFKQFLSKKWIGNFNLFLFRKNAFKSKNLESLPSLFKRLNVELLFITGDFSSTASKEEFLSAKQFLELFSTPTLFLPGNHDCYTKKNEKEQTYYKYFNDENGIHNFSLKKDKVYGKKIKDGFWGVCLDCALPTPPFNSYGVFTSDMAKKLETILESIPKQDTVIIGNHFPLFPANRPKHDLKNSATLRALLKKYEVKLYLHGHDHKPYIIDRRNEGYPLVLNSGSSAMVKKGGFYLVDFQDDIMFVNHYFFNQETGWTPEQKHVFK